MMNPEDIKGEGGTEPLDGSKAPFRYHLSDDALKAMRSFQAEWRQQILGDADKLALSASQLMSSYPGLHAALEASSAYFSHMTEVRQQVQASLSRLSIDFESFMPALQPQVFEASQRMAKAILDSLPKVDYAELSATFKKAHDSHRFLKILEDSHWPLYLVDRDEMLEELLGLDASLVAEELKAAVFDVAAWHLDGRWLESTKARWSSMDDLSADEQVLLENALERHESEDYIGSVAILMCLFEGFTERLAKASSALANVNPELFDWEAKKHSMRPIRVESGGYRKLYAKDHVLLLLLQTEQGWHTWRAASNYIIDVVLVNKYDENLARHNPLRNKICHGAQTNYGTWEHSAKAILSTDMILRMGLAAMASLDGSCEENTC